MDPSYSTGNLLNNPHRPLTSTLRNSLQLPSQTQNNVIANETEKLFLRKQVNEAELRNRLYTGTGKRGAETQAWGSRSETHSLIPSSPLLMEVTRHGYATETAKKAREKVVKISI